MTIFIHVLFAVMSIALALGSLFKPSQRLLRFVYVSTAGAVISGIFLSVQSHANLTRACISGSLFLGFIIASSIISRKRLAVS